MLFTEASRQPLERVRVRVWGWEKPEVDSHSVVLSRIAAYIDLAWRSGLHPDDIVDDICDKFPAYFEDGELEVKGGIATIVLAPTS
jgi:hypothetical protein